MPTVHMLPLGMCMSANSYLLSLSINVSVVGYAFIYFEDERDAEDAIQCLDNVSFGYSRRRLSVEWSRVISCLYLAGIFSFSL